MAKSMEKKDGTKVPCLMNDDFTETKKEIASSTHFFLEAFNGIQLSSNFNDHIISMINNFTKTYFTDEKTLLNCLIMISLANAIPIAQFIVDIYTECVLKYGLTINEFMENSTFFRINRMLPYNSKELKIIRRYLSQYLKYFYLPISKDYDSQIAAKHNMSRILYYTSIIDDNIYILNKVCQIDVIFIPQSAAADCSWINDKYFNKLCITYASNHDIDHSNGKQKTSMKQMMRHFNDKLKDRKFQRCVVLINGDSDTVYIFKPLQNNSLSREIYNCTEIPWICNTKSNILPGLKLSESDYGSLCLSFHVHHDDNNVCVKRVYLSYDCYGCRVFKHNLRGILQPFCIDNNCKDFMVDWDEQVNDREFGDYQYNLFKNAYFADLKLAKPDINIYVNASLYDGNAWIKTLYKCVVYDINDKQSSLILELVKEYMYIPSPMECYLYLNIKINEYYVYLNKEYNDQFIQFIYDNELEDCPLSDNLGTNVDMNDCVLLDFDVHFPIVGNDKNLKRDEFLFDFLQKLIIFTM